MRMMGRWNHGGSNNRVIRSIGFGEERGGASKSEKKGMVTWDADHLKLENSTFMPLCCKLPRQNMRWCFLVYIWTP